MKLILLSIITLLFAFPVTANELEGQATINELITETKAIILRKCQCTVNFSVNWNSFNSNIALNKAGYTIENFKQSMPSFCGDDGKEVGCSIKNVNISFDKTTTSRFSSGTAEFTTDGITHGTFDNIISIIRPEKDAK